MRVLLPTIAIVASLALASSAGASSLSYASDGSLVYTAGSNETNSGLVDTSPYSTTCGPVVTPCIHIIDWGAYIDLGSLPAGCAADNQTQGWPQWGEAACPVPPRLRVNLGDMNDNWNDWDGPSMIDAGPGSDNAIFGAGGNDVIHGGSGNDVLVGGTGNDTLDGGVGDDDFEGIPGERLFGGNPPSQGTDTYIGGGGGDAVVYTGRGEDLSLSLDGVANDGEPGENDNIGPDVTTVLGGDGSDVIVGDDYANALAGDTGDDVIEGRGGDDRLFGGSGADRLDAGVGQDYLEGDDAGDVLIGGPDVDTFYGEDPLNASNGTTGRDQIFSRDGNPEFVSCGPGIDAAQVDGSDQVRNWVATDDQCESIDSDGPAGGGGSSGGGGGGSHPGGGSGGSGGGGNGGGSRHGVTASALASRAGKIRVTLMLPGPGAVSVRAVARLHGHKTVVGHRARRAATGGPFAITLRPSAAARRALRAHRRLKATVKVTFSPSGRGTKVTLTRSVVLRRAGTHG
jgi:hypothetical protein